MNYEGRTNIFISYSKKQTKNLKINFLNSNVQVKLEQKTSNGWDFMRRTGLWEPNPTKNVQIFLQILNPVNDADVLAPDLIGGQEKWKCNIFQNNWFISNIEET